MAGGSGHTNSDGRRHLEETFNVGLKKSEEKRMVLTNERRASKVAKKRII